MESSVSKGSDLIKCILCTCTIVFFVVVSCLVWSEDAEVKSILGSGTGEFNFVWPIVLGRGFNLSVDFDQIVLTTTFAVSGTDVRKSRLIVVKLRVVPFHSRSFLAVMFLLRHMKVG